MNQDHLDIGEAQLIREYDDRIGEPVYIFRGKVDTDKTFSFKHYFDPRRDMPINFTGSHEGAFKQEIKRIFMADITELDFPWITDAIKNKLRSCLNRLLREAGRIDAGSQHHTVRVRGYFLLEILHRRFNFAIGGPIYPGHLHGIQGLTGNGEHRTFYIPHPRKQSELTRMERTEELFGETITIDGKTKRRYTLGEINEILEKEGFSEITDGPCIVSLPTTHHHTCWNAPGKFVKKSLG